ncbi:MAG: hypothetical protein HQL95_11495 [Magnetococcales bacterium]|nr:hypothetical protein [Magnetococcales bacterium]
MAEAEPEPGAGGGRWARIGVLALLPMIAGIIHWDGQRYDPGLLDFKNAAARLSPLVGLFPERTAGVVRQGELRRFNKENLHEYVNGHAEYYISAGFKELVVGEYGVEGEQQGRPKVVVDLFDMGKPLFAFGVLTGEGGNEGREAGIGEMGFLDPRGLRFIAGPYYVKMTAFADGAPLELLGRALAGSMGKTAGARMEGLRFPEYGKPLATRFIKENYRGMDFFSQVLERSFEWEGQTIQAFQTGESAAQSREVESRLLEFLQKDQIPVERRDIAGQGIHVVQDRYEGEWFFLRAGERLMGAFGIPLDKAATPLKEYFTHGGQTDGGSHP